MERVSKIRHEYIEGTIYAMAGGSRSHNKIAMNTGFALHQHVKGTAGDVYMSDVKLKIAHCRSRVGKLLYRLPTRNCRNGGQAKRRLPTLRNRNSRIKHVI